MSDLNRYLQDVFRNGKAATMTVITGTSCPCMISRDASRPSYSAEWHRDNLTAAVCNGTGKISTTTTVTNIIIWTVPAQLIGKSVREGIDLSTIGELTDKDHFSFGAVNASTGAQITLANLIESKDKITVDSINYLVRAVYPIICQGGSIEYALLKRIS